MSPNCLERGDQLRKLCVTADQWRLGTVRAARAAIEGARLGAQDDVAANGIGNALDGEWRLFRHIEQASDMAVRGVTDPESSNRSGLLEACGDVDRNATNAAIGIDTSAQQHRSSVDADTHVEVPAPVAFSHLLLESVRFVEYVESRAHRTLGIVFTRLEKTKNRQQAIAGVLQNPPPPRLDERGEAPECAVHDGLDILWIELLADRGGSHHIGEQNRHRPQLWSGRVDSGQPGAQCGERGVDYGIAEDSALSLQGGDAAFELFTLCHPSPPYRGGEQISASVGLRAHGASPSGFRAL